MRFFFKLIFTSILVLLFSKNAAFSYPVKNQHLAKNNQKLLLTREPNHTQNIKKIKENQEEIGKLKQIISNSKTINCRNKRKQSKFTQHGKDYIVVGNEYIKDPVNLQKILAGKENWCTSQVTNMARLFKNNKDFNQDISNWDVSKVNDMTEMFNNSKKFNQDISNWDVSKVKSMRSMFAGATRFNNGNKSLAWKGHKSTKEVTDMSHMFELAVNFDQDISMWNVSNVKSMQGMFAKARIFNNGGKALTWTAGESTAKVENMSFMFYQSLKFNQDVSSWDVGKVTNMEAMFAYAISFNNGGSINNHSKEFLDSYYYLSKTSYDNDIPYDDIKLNQDASVQVSNFLISR